MNTRERISRARCRSSAERLRPTRAVLHNPIEQLLKIGVGLLGACSARGWGSRHRLARGRAWRLARRRRHGGAQRRGGRRSVSRGTARHGPGRAGRYGVEAAATGAARRSTGSSWQDSAWPTTAWPATTWTAAGIGTATYGDWTAQTWRDNTWSAQHVAGRRLVRADVARPGLGLIAWPARVRQDGAGLQVPPRSAVL